MRIHRFKGRSAPVGGGFAAGGGTGTLVADVWTPAKAGDGRVYAESWATIPTGRWTEIAGSELSQVEAQIRAAYTDWPSPNPIWLDGVQRSWSHPAIDTAQSRLFYACSGGHSDGANNGVYTFDAFKMAWAIEDMQQNPMAWTTTYRTSGNFTTDPESDALAAAQNGAANWQPINGTGYDELYYSGTGSPTATTNNKKPTARHLYYGLAYLPDHNQLAVFSRRFWLYDLTTHAWTYKRAFADAYDAPTTGTNILGESCLAYYDQTRQQILAGGGGSGDSTCVKWDIATQAWVSATNIGRKLSISASCTHDGKVVTVSLPSSGTGEPNGGYRRWVISSQTTESTSYDLGLGELGFQYGAGTSISDFKAGYGYDFGGMVYIPSLDRYWVWAIGASPDRIALMCEIDPTTTPWTLTKKAAMSGSSNYTGWTVNDGTSISPVWMPSLNAVLLISRGAATRMMVYKF